MRIDHVNIAFFVIFLSTSILWLIGIISGYGNVLFKGMPMLCLSLSLGFILTWWVVFKRLGIYGIIFAWMQEYLNVPKSIVSGKWRSVNWSNLLPLLALAWPIRDMTVRWNIVQQRWSVAFPQYTEVILHIAAVLYILYIVSQGTYLVAVATKTQTVLKYGQNEQAQKCAWNLILVNLGLLIYDIIWIMTTLTIESDGEHILLKLLNLGCVGLVLYDICAVVVLANLLFVISSQPVSGTDCDDPSKTIAWLRKLIPVFLFLSISREFNSLIFPSTLAAFLPILFLTLGSVVFLLEICLLHRWLFKTLLINTMKQYTCKMNKSSIFMAVLSINSCLVNAYQGYDSYQRWLSDKHPTFTAFLAVYCTIYTLHIAYEGFLVVWQLSHLRSKPGEESAKKRNITILSTCAESSLMFAIYQVLVLLCLPDAGVNLATLWRVSGPLLFHVSTVVACIHLKNEAYWSQNQAQNAPTVLSDNYPVIPAHPSALDYIPRLWQTASATIANYQYALSLLMLLAMLRWMLFGEVLALFLPPWFMTRCYWYAYILVCGHWLLVMHRDLHSLPVIKKCCSSRTASQNKANTCLGIMFLLVATLTVLAIGFRASHSAHEWGGQRTLVFQIMVVPLLGIHVYAILLQGLLLYCAVTATDFSTEATECEVPAFTENLQKLKHLNLVLLLDHLIFMVLSNGSVSILTECSLLLFHVGSICIISRLQHRGKELDKSSHEQKELESRQSIPTAYCMLVRWIPLQNTGHLMKITILAAFGSVAVKFYNFQGDWIIVVVFRLLTAAMFAVVNYYIYKASTKHLVSSQRRHLLWPNGKPTVILYMVIGLFGVASVGYAFYRQWTAEGDGLFLLDLSLTIEALMDVLLIIHEDILVIFLVSLDPRVQDKHCNLKQGLQWALHLNKFYMAIGPISPLLAWLDSENGSIINLLGQISCAIFVPFIASLLLNRMYNDINKDLQSNEIGTNQQLLEEEGRSKRVCSNPPALPDSYRRSVCRSASN